MIGATVAIGAVGVAVNFIALGWSPAATLRFISPFHYYTPGDVLAQGHVLWPQLGCSSAPDCSGCFRRTPC